MPILTSSQLRAADFSRARVERAIRSGDVIRVRRGWFATSDVMSDVVAAVRAGGSLSCSAALRRHGVWVLSDVAHVRVDPKGHPRAGSTVAHRLPGTADHGVDDLATALAAASRCLTRNELVCPIDSVLNKGLATRSVLERLLTTRRGRRALALADGRSESGLETLARLGFRALNLRVRVQVTISGIGRVDLIIGDRLVVELDGDEWHSTSTQRERDRRRDSALVAKGYLVIRAGYSRVVHEWAELESEVLAVVRRREHLWRFVHGGG